MDFQKSDFRKTDATNFPKNRYNLIQRQQPKGFMGTTWDANHLTSFLNRSFYSNKKSPQKEQRQSLQKKFSSSIKKNKNKQDYFFKNLRHDMNTSHIGFTKINPLVANVQISQKRRQPLLDFFNSRAENLYRKSQYPTIQKQKTREQLGKLRCDQNSKFKYQSNMVKYKHTDPLTNKYQPEKPEKIGFSLQRMKRQINVRYQHGIVGIDNPTNNQSLIYQPINCKKTLIRQQPISKNSFLLSRQWKTKKRADVPLNQQFQFRKTQYIRKFRNQNSHGYNIVTNRIVQQ